MHWQQSSGVLEWRYGCWLRNRDGGPRLRDGAQCPGLCKPYRGNWRDERVRGQSAGKDSDSPEGNSHRIHPGGNLDDPGARSHITGVHRTLTRIKKQRRRGDLPVTVQRCCAIAAGTGPNVFVRDHGIHSPVPDRQSGFSSGVFFQTLSEFFRTGPYRVRDESPLTRAEGKFSFG